MSDTLWSGQVPDTTDNSDGTPGITTATTIQVAQARSCTGIQFRATDTKGGTYTIELWQCTVADDDVPDGTLLASRAFAASAVTAGAYNELQFTTPVALSTGVLYRCAVHNTDGRYVRSGSTFSAAGLTNGDITAYQNGTDPSPPGLGGMRQGNFRISATAGAYPTQSGNGASYFVGPALAVAAMEGAGTAVLGALAATAAGTRARLGAAVANLAGLTAAAAGSRARTGIAAAALGALSATASGARAKTGTGVANLGRLVATANTGTVIPVPRAGTITRPSTGTIEVPRITYP